MTILQEDKISIGHVHKKPQLHLSYTISSVTETNIHCDYVCLLREIHLQSVKALKLKVN
jgi:hypothetical protein